MTMLVPWTAEELTAICAYVVWYMGLVHHRFVAPPPPCGPKYSVLG